MAEVTELLLTLSGTPTADKAARTADPRLSAARMCSKVKGVNNLELRKGLATVVALVDRDRKARLALERRGGFDFPRATRTRSALLQSTLFSNKKGQAWQTHSAYLAAAEVMVVDTQEKSVLRCYAFWRCLECWGALRFSDLEDCRQLTQVCTGWSPEFLAGCNWKLVTRSVSNVRSHHIEAYQRYASTGRQDAPRRSKRGTRRTRARARRVWRPRPPSFLLPPPLPLFQEKASTPLLPPLIPIPSPPLSPPHPANICVIGHTSN